MEKDKKLREFEAKLSDLVLELYESGITEDDVKEYFGASSPISEMVSELYEEFGEEERILKSLADKLSEKGGRHEA